MHALLFEVEPREGHEECYFTHAATLRPLLQEHTGLLFLDRFRSLSRPRVILSHSHWQDDAALAKWRVDAQHRKSQKAGRHKHFRDYRIRISHVVRHYRRDDASGTTLPDAIDVDTGSGDVRFLTIIASERQPFSSVAGETFLSVNFEDTYLTVASAPSVQEGLETVAGASATPTVTSAMASVVIRDYGMFEREEAPQSFEPVETER